MIMNIPDNSKDIEKIKDTLGYTLGKNLLNHAATNQTKSEVEVVVNDDRSITLNGTVSLTDFVNIANSTRLQLPKGEYILSGCPQGGSESTYYMTTMIKTNGEYIEYIDTGEGVKFTIDSENSIFYVCRINIIGGQVYDNLTFYPMIRKASITDNTYEPYRGNHLSSVDARLDTVESSIRGIDTSNKLYSFTAKGTASNGTNDMSYVAEKDCYAFISYYGASTAKIYLDNLTVFQTNDKVFRNFIIPIKKGQKVRGYTNDGVSSYVTCEFYGLL